jgi:hypothetical protein
VPEQSVIMIIGGCWLGMQIRKAKGKREILCKKLSRLKSLEIA